MKNYEIVFNGQTYTLTEEELRDPDIKARLPEDLEFRVVTKPSTSKPDLGNVFTYSITEKSGPKKGIEIGKVSATSTRDALAQAEAMGFEIGTFNVNRTTGSVEPTAKPTTVKEREALLTKRGVDKNDVADMARYMPYASADLYNKPADEVSYGTMQRDVFSLPGRVITSALPWGREITGVDAKGEPVREDFGTAVGRTSEAEGTNFLGAIGRSPATGVAVPLSLLAAPAVASVPFIEGALATGAVEGGLVGAGTSAFNYATDEDYTIADAVIETLLSAGIGSLIKSGSAKSIEKAKNMIRSAGNFKRRQIDYIYNKLGITRGGTTKNLEESVPYEFDKLGDIEYSYRSKAPTDADNFPKVVRDILQADYEKGWQKGAEPAVDIGNVIPDETIYSYDRLIRNGIANRTINPEQAAKKFKILEEYKQWKQHLDQVNTEMGDEPVDLNKIIKDAQYFYQKDPELGNIILDNIDAQYKMSYVKMMTDPESATEGIELAPLADLKSKFLNLNTITQYTANPPVKVAPRPFNAMEPGSWVGQTAGRVVNTPESGKLVGNALQALRMPSIVATQDVTGNKLPTYLNLNQMRSK